VHNDAFANDNISCCAKTVIPVVFCFDKRIILGASVAIKSLIDCAKSETAYDIRIFHSDIELVDQKNISKLAENTRHNIAFHYINPEIFKNAPHNEHSWTELVYYRLLTPEILKEYDKVIYSDVDVLFRGDLSEIYNINIEHEEIAAVPVEKNIKDKMICHTYFPENKNEKIYISSFLVMNTKIMREEKFVERVFDVIKTVNKRLKFFDLDTMNIACNRFKSIPFTYGVFQSIMYNDDITQAHEYKFLKSIYSDEELLSAKKDPVMIHYAGYPGKPWRLKNPYPDYKECIDSLPKELQKYTFRDFRKRLFSKV